MASSCSGGGKPGACLSRFVRTSAIGGDVPADQILARLGFSQVEVSGDQPFDIKLVRIHQKADERFLVVRLIGNVREDEQARFSCAHAAPTSATIRVRTENDLIIKFILTAFPF